jgi:molecular chaperone GrpE
MSQEAFYTNETVLQTVNQPNAADHQATVEPAPVLPTPPVPQSDPSLLQMQNRLFHLATQIEQIQTQLARLASESQFSGNQLAGLTRHLTDVQATNALSDRVADLTTQLADQQTRLDALAQLGANAARREQVEQLAQAIAQTANREQVAQVAQTMLQRDHLEQLTLALAKAARQEEVERLTQAVAQTANQSQIERLLQVVADRDTVANLEEAIKKLGRTQFKSNTLGESKEQQVASALATLQEIVTRREEAEENRGVRNAEELSAARRESRAELAAELLPALDSLELALAHGGSILDQQQAQLRAVTAQYRDYLTAQTRYWDGLAQAPSPSFWQRLRGQPQLLEGPPSVQPVPPDHFQALFQGVSDNLSAWLRGLELVRERFFALLAGEGIEPIDALNQPFDPRLHVAVQAEVRRDAPPNTVVRVVRKGYRQQNRVLRYAEVVVAGEPTGAQTA